MSNDSPKNPFFKSQQDHQENVYENIAKGKENWRRITFIVGLYALLVTGAFVVRAFQAKYRPYIVKVDSLGHPVSFGPAKQLKSGKTRIIQAELYGWLQKIRGVHGSIPLIKRNMNGAFNMLSGDVSKQLNKYFSTPNHDPRMLIGKFRRSVKIRSIIEVDKDDHKWKLRWIETMYPRGSDSRVNRQEWVTYIKIKRDPPTTSKIILTNPLGIYITSLSWEPITPIQ